MPCLQFVPIHNVACLWRCAWLLHWLGGNKFGRTFLLTSPYGIPFDLTLIRPITPYQLWPSLRTRTVTVFKVSIWPAWSMWFLEARYDLVFNIIKQIHQVKLRLTSYKKWCVHLELEHQPTLAGMTVHLGRINGCSGVCPTMWTNLTRSLNWEWRREQGDYGSPRKPFTNSIPIKKPWYTGGQYTLAFHNKCLMPVGVRNKL